MSRVSIRRVSNLNRLIFSYLYLLILSISTFNSADKQFIFQNDPNLCGIYCQMSKNYFANLINQDFDIYYFQKSLVSLLTNLILRVLAVPNSPENINTTLEIISLLSLFIASFFWWRISNFVRLSNPNYWVVFIGLFGSQLFVKVSPYSQDGSDNISFSLGMAVLYFIISKSYLGLWSCYLLSFLIQPQLRILIIPLILFFGFSCNFGKYTDFKIKLFTYLTRSVYILVFMCSILIILFWIPLANGAEHTIFVLLPISIVLSSLLLSGLLIPLLTSMNLMAILNHLVSARRILAIFVFIEILFRFLIHSVGKGEIMSINSQFYGQIYFLFSNYFHAVALPLLWVIAPILFFGPVVILIVVFYKKIFTKTIFLENFGLGISLVLIVILLPNTESRHHIAYLPWLFYILVSRVNFNTAYVYFIFTPLMIATSRFYGSYAPTNQSNDPYLMSWGPWMSQEVYLTGLLVLSPVLLLHLYFRNRIAILAPTIYKPLG